MQTAASATLRVLTLADDAYSIPLAVMVRSLLEAHRSSLRLEVTIIDAGISPENRSRLEASWRGVVPEERAGWKFCSPCYGPRSPGPKPALTQARVPLEDYFDDPRGRMLVLCSDTLVLRDPAALYAHELDGAVLGATIDPYIPVASAPRGHPSWCEDGVAPDAPYFNTGAMVVDLERWCQERVTARASEYLTRFLDPGRISDQEILNAVLVGRWKQVDGRWQTHPRTRYSLGIPVSSDPWIVHFSGRLRPWSYRTNQRWDRRFFEVLDRTAWSGFRPAHNVASWAMRLYDSPMRRLLYPLETRLLSRRG